MRILVIDDCKLTGRLICGFLRPFGKALVVSDGTAGIGAFRNALDESRPFELISLDISMPGLDGFQTLKAIRQLEDDRNIPADKKAKVLMITAFSDEDSILSTYRDCQGFLLKPVRRAKLFEKLASMGIFPGGEEASLPSAAESGKTESFESPSRPDYQHMIPLIRNDDSGPAFYVCEDLDGDSASCSRVEPGDFDFFRNVITGQMIARADGPDVELEAGDGVCFNPAKGLFFAEKDGRVVFDGSRLSIEDTLVFDSDVKNTDIDFLGKVVINADVKDGVRINAVQGLKIKGTVGDCFLKSDGDIEVERMHGHNSGEIKCGGNLRIRFVYDTTIECRKDIVVEVEAVDCVIKSSGRVKAGTVIGGQCIALVSIDVRRVGSPKDVSTLLRAGFDFYRTDRKKLLEENIRAIDAELERCSRLLGPYSEDLGTSLVLPENQKKLIFSLAAKKQHLEDTRQGFVRELEAIGRSAGAKLHSMISVSDSLHKGVRLQIGDLEELVEGELKGPFRLSKDLISL